MTVQPVDDGNRVLAAMQRDDIQFLLAMFTDMRGKPCAKLIPASAVELFLEHGVGFAGFAAGPLGQSPADPDIIAVADSCSYTPLPWSPGVAAVQCDLFVGGRPWAFSPRHILKRQLERFADRHLTLMVGAEVEYMLVKRRADGSVDVADGLDRSVTPCYDARDLVRSLPHLAAVSKNVEQLGWQNYANDHEDANGQFEQNFQYANALTTADRVVLFRFMVRCLAEEAGVQATFMPKPFTSNTGNGLHLHLSVWNDSGDELFADSGDERGLGMSSFAYSFIAGLLDHAPAWIAFTCPTVNSYKRIASASTVSGESWAPSVISYGGNNRTHMLRIPEPGRVENRAVDGSANPYLALAALATAGLDGIDRGLDPGPPGVDGQLPTAAGARHLPPTLLHAVEQLKDDEVLRSGMGSAVSGDYVDYFIDIKRAEFAAYHAQVTAWELDEYLSLF